MTESIMLHDRLNVPGSVPVPMQSEEDSLEGSHFGAVQASPDSTSEKSTPRTLPDSLTDSGSTSTSNPSQGRRSSSFSQTGHRKTRSRSSSANRVGAHRRLSNDPLDHTALTFKNILVLEQSLREQYVKVQASRQKHMVFFSGLLITTAYYYYAIFVNPSVYNLILLLDRLIFTACLVSLVLFYATGMYYKAFVYYPRYLATANRGLRPFNIKLVKISKPWLDFIVNFVQPGYCSVPGGGIKIVLSTRRFNSSIIEAWEVYRNEYWWRESKRKKRDRETKT